MTSAEINAELVCPLRTRNFPPGTQDYDLKRHNLIEGVSKCMISDDRPCFTKNGPNTSTPTASKARTPTVQRETGKFAIFCDKTDEYSFRHTTHLALMPLRIALILGIQNLLLTTLTVQLVPRWASPWNCWSINVDIMMRWQNHFMLGVARQCWTWQTTSNPQQLTIQDGIKREDVTRRLDLLATTQSSDLFTIDIILSSPEEDSLSSNKVITRHGRHFTLTRCN